MQPRPLKIGLSARLTDRLSTDLEVSGGSLGAAGAATLRYDNNAGSQYHFGYRLDPMRRFDSSTFKPSDGGTWVVGADKQVNEKLTYRAENTYDIYGTSPSLLSSYGVRYTPSASTTTWPISPAAPRVLSAASRRHLRAVADGVADARLAAALRALADSGAAPDEG